MKKILLTAGAIMAIASPSFAADYNGFISPSSLGKSINTLNKQYKVGLKKYDEYGYYANSDSASCSLYVATDKKQLVKSIQITDANDCKYTVKSNVNFNSATTTATNLLNQVNLSEVYFVPGCFNCPSRIELSDDLVITRAKDSYYTKFNIQGYNRDYHEFIAKKVLGKYSENDHYTAMDKLDEKSRTDDKFLNREDLKLKAIKTYSLKEIPHGYEIGLK